MTARRDHGPVAAARALSGVVTDLAPGVLRRLGLGPASLVRPGAVPAVTELSDKRPRRLKARTLSVGDKWSDQASTPFTSRIPV